MNMRDLQQIVLEVTGAPLSYYWGVIQKPGEHIMYYPWLEVLEVLYISSYRIASRTPML